MHDAILKGTSEYVLPRVLCSICLFRTQHWCASTSAHTTSFQCVRRSRHLLRSIKEFDICAQIDKVTHLSRFPHTFCCPFIVLRTPDFLRVFFFSRRKFYVCTYGLHPFLWFIIIPLSAALFGLCTADLSHPIGFLPLMVSFHTQSCPPLSVCTRWFAVLIHIRPER